MAKKITPKQLFDIVVNNNKSLVLDSTSNIFEYICLTFFSLVPLNVKYKDKADISNLKTEYGGFEILEDITDINTIVINPDDYDKLILPSSYHQAFMYVCEFFLLQTNYKNLSIIKDNFGTSEATQPNIEYSQIKEALRVEFGIEVSTIV